MLLIDKNDLEDSALENLFMLYSTKVECDVASCEEYRKIQYEICSLEEQVKANLNQTQLLHYDKILSELDNSNAMMYEAHFKEGFVQAVRLMSEIDYLTK